MIQLPIEALVVIVLSFLGWIGTIIGIYTSFSSDIAVLKEKNQVKNKRLDILEEVIGEHESELKKLLNEIKNSVHDLSLQIQHLKDTK